MNLLKDIISKKFAEKTIEIYIKPIYAKSPNGKNKVTAMQYGPSIPSQKIKQ